MALFNLRRIWDAVTLRGGVFKEIKEDQKTFVESIVIVFSSSFLMNLYALWELPSFIIAILFGAPMIWFIGTMVLHVIARILGGHSGFRAYLRATGYCHMPLALGVIPGFGPLLGLIWACVCAVVATKETHGFSIWKAIITVLLPVLFVVGLLVLFALMVGMSMSAA